MKDGFIKVAACAPQIKVADVQHNTEVICRQIAEATKLGARIVVFPELAITGATCGDLFTQHFLLDAAQDALCAITESSATTGDDAVIFVGLPMEMDGKLYNVSAAIQAGHLLALIPQKHVPAGSAKARWFVPGNEAPVPVMLEDDLVPFGTRVLIDASDTVDGLIIGCETGEDALHPTAAPHTELTAVGVTVMVHPDATPENVDSDSFRRRLVTHTSGQVLCGYVHASAGYGESTTDSVFSGHHLVAECGELLAENTPFPACSEDAILITEIDVKRIREERMRDTLFACAASADDTYHRAIVNFAPAETVLTRRIGKNPFLPDDEGERSARLSKILKMQALGLKKRMEHVGCNEIVIGISGGLDSTLAMLVAADCLDMMGLLRENLLAITMPCFGTSERTHGNAKALSEAIGAAFEEVDISDAVRQHFKDIDQDEERTDAAYENAQARERMQVLMDTANQVNGIVAGTGDLSELALGWCTYNGDHMSMYSVNADIPKTVVRALVRHYADTRDDDKLKKVLYDIADTPVSPELLPAKDGETAQKTEDIIGPYELHDFFLYYMLRRGFEPKKILRLAVHAFEGRYNEETVKKWLTVFYRRFFSQQFKRSCLPDGVGVGSVTLSPRGGWMMPSDAVGRLWLDELAK